MTTLIIVRHGETTANVAQVWQGSLDAPLTERGRKQVAATAQRVAELAREYPVDAFYVSPLPRAQSTAAAIAESISIQPVIEDGLREFDLGDWEGRSFLDLKESEDLWEHWDRDPSFAPPNGESPRSFGARAVQIFQDLADRHPTETVLVVTHGALICNVLASWFGAGPQDWRRWEAHNCAISVLTWDGSHWRAVLTNDIGHLPPETVVVETDPIYASAGQ